MPCDFRDEVSKVILSPDHLLMVGSWGAYTRLQLFLALVGSEEAALWVEVKVTPLPDCSFEFLS